MSYAWEDGALAEWLTLRLTSEGYRVWCDRFKILGGERWPDDVDTAIRNRTFRMLHLVSKHSLQKPNPKKERELALQLERKRGSEILIPLNVDGTKPSDLPWRIVDVAFIPFENWASGLSQLLKKLDSVGAPRPLAVSGRQVASSAFLIPSPVVERDEHLVSNVFAFTSVPRVLRHFRFDGRVEWGEMSALGDSWAFRNMGGKGALAFAAPPGPIATRHSIKETGTTELQDGGTVEGVLAEHLVTELLGKSLDVHCRTRGLAWDPEERVFHFPLGLLPRNTLWFDGYRGKRSRVLACGYRRFGGRRHRYHLAGSFRVRHDMGTGFVAQLRLRVHITDERGGALDQRASLARRKRIGAGWWNGHWLNRQLALMSFISDGEAEIRMGEDPESQVVLAASPMNFSVGRGINEALLATIGVPPGVLPVKEDDVAGDTE